MSKSVIVIQIYVVQICCILELFEKKNKKIDRCKKFYEFLGFIYVPPKLLNTKYVKKNCETSSQKVYV